VRLDDERLDAATSDIRGVPTVGRRRELAALRRTGAESLPAGRIYEGHVNALQLIGRFGTPQQRARAVREAAASFVFGVWNSQERDGVSMVADGSKFRLSGSKTWCSGAGEVLRPIVTAKTPSGADQMIVVPMDRVAATIDASDWIPLGMTASNSYRVCFDGVVVEPRDLLGSPGAYQQGPWFLGGAIRFVAVQVGGIDRIVDETTAYLVRLQRQDDPLQKLRIAKLQIARQSCSNWLDVAADAWTEFDRDPNALMAERATNITDMARVAIEEHALAVIADAERCVGARGLLEPLPFAAVIRDLQMYLRQPAPDAALMRVAGSATASIADASTASASSTGTRV